ncbi:Acetyltransferase (GNAT) family protein [Micromonospora inyonensis]|uniref:Acetyltransferase (GNAT) family protein n=1 Tax=Micromonospora inyonensis TaxID=47866 RepID=A0A1C6SBU5_9ACTN|nr:Acetyltransferase (GNAT) family protein [Micromonospora inyonensis]
MPRPALTPVTTATPELVELINADRMPGQPACTLAMVQAAIDGTSPVDSAWWAELADLRTEVLPGADGTPAGAIAYARRPRDGAGVILWLHAREVPAVVRALLDHALVELAGCPTVEAFTFATALGLGLEALPVRHRPATHSALTDLGFAGSDLWRYMCRDLPAAGLPTCAYRTRRDEDRRVLEVERDGKVIAEATIGDPVDGVGVLWWIGVEPVARGDGLGLRMLGAALAELAASGAQQVILYVDDDAPDDDPERSRAAANAMYERAGFAEVDRLWSYQLTR